MEARGDRYLLDLVRRLDLTMGADVGAEHVTFVRALLAAGTLLPLSATIERTLAAARSFLESPSEASYAALQIAATGSFPFGPGDGCLSVAQLGVEGCGPGSGCVSGSGTLVYIAEVAGWEACTAAVRTALSEPARA